MAGPVSVPTATAEVLGHIGWERVAPSKHTSVDIPSLMATQESTHLVSTVFSLFSKEI